MVLLISVLVFLGVSYLIGRVILFVFGVKANRPNPEPDMSNPYVAAHLGQLANDRQYDEYLSYLDKNSIEGIPFDKEITLEEYRMKKELDLGVG